MIDFNQLEGPRSFPLVEKTKSEKGKQKSSVRDENFLGYLTFADLSPEPSSKEFQNAKAKQIDDSSIRKLDKNLFEQAIQIEKEISILESAVKFEDRLKGKLDWTLGIYNILSLALEFIPHKELSGKFKTIMSGMSWVMSALEVLATGLELKKTYKRKSRIS